MAKKKSTATANKPSTIATTATSTFDDGKFVRTSLLVGEGSGSVDLVCGKDGRTRLAQVNVFYTSDGTLMVDVIDVDGQFASHRAIGFSSGERPQSVPTDSIVGAHFSNEVES